MTLTYSEEDDDKCLCIKPENYVGVETSIFMQEAITAYLEAMIGFITKDEERMRRGFTLIYTLSMIDIDKQSYGSTPYETALIMMPEDVAKQYTDEKVVNAFNDRMVTEVRRAHAIISSLWGEDRFDGHIRWPELVHYPQ